MSTSAANAPPPQSSTSTSSSTSASETWTGDSAVLEVAQYVAELADQYEIVEAVYDPWRAGQMAQEWEQRGIRAVAVPAIRQPHDPRLRTALRRRRPPASSSTPTTPTSTATSTPPSHGTAGEDGASRARPQHQHRRRRRARDGRRAARLPGRTRRAARMAQPGTASAAAPSTAAARTAHAATTAAAAPNDGRTPRSHASAMDNGTSTAAARRPHRRPHPALRSNHRTATVDDCVTACRAATPASPDSWVGDCYPPRRAAPRKTDAARSRPRQGTPAATRTLPVPALRGRSSSRR